MENQNKTHPNIKNKYKMKKHIGKVAKELNLPHEKARSVKDYILKNKREQN